MMTMQKITKNGNVEQYFMEGEYYLSRDGKSRDPSVWIGNGAKTLGLEGKGVEVDDFKNMLDGFSPTGKKLTVNAGRENRTKLAVDCTNSAPKSVSIAMAYASPELRDAIIEASQAANAVSIGYLEKHLHVYTGKNGQDAVKAQGAAVASFTHFTSRALDPQMHHHNLVMMMAKREDGTWGGIDEAELRRHQKAAGAIYRSELAASLQNLGFGIEADSKNPEFGFKIVGIEDKAVEHMSKRRTEMLKWLKKHGKDPKDVAACQKAARHTREAKNEPSMQDMLEIWKISDKALGLNAQKIEQLTKAPAQNAEQSIDLAATLDKITEHESVFEEKDVVQAIAYKAAQLGGLRLSQIEELTRQALQDQSFDLGDQVRKKDRINAQDNAIKLDPFTPVENPNAKPRGIRATRHIYSTKNAVAREIAIYETFKEAQKDTKHNRSEAQVQAAIEAYQAKKSAELGKPVQMKQEQIDAVKHIATSGRAALVVGYAGTGKSFTMGCVRELEEAAGQKVIATALAGKAAGGLKEGASIKDGGTIASILIAIQSGQLVPDAKTTIILDEAGMVGAKDFYDLQRLAPNSKIIALGDHKQFQNIAGGNFFAGLQDLGFNAAKLTEITRQNADWHREAVLDFKDGLGAKALQAFADRGLMQWHDTEQDALQAIAKEYVQQQDSTGSTIDARQKLSLVSTNEHARIINKEVRKLLKERGEIDAVDYCVAFTAQNKSTNQEYDFTREISVGERVRFTKNNKMLGVMNGDLGTIKEIVPLQGDDYRLVIQKDNDKIVKLNLSEYSRLELGYAFTGHSSQGVTVQRAGVFLDPDMLTREAAYVLGSRSKNATMLHAVRGDSANLEEAMAQLARAVSRSGAKDWTLDYMSAEQREAFKEALRNESQPQKQAQRTGERTYNVDLSEPVAAKKIQDKAVEQSNTPQPQAQKQVKNTPEQQKQQEKEEGTLRNPIFKTLTAGATISIKKVAYADKDWAVLQEQDGRHYLYENKGVLAATFRDSEGSSKTLAEALKEREKIDAKLITGQDAKPISLKMSGETYTANANNNVSTGFGTNKRVCSVKNFSQTKKQTVGLTR